MERKVTRVRKRDGRIVPFDRTKIADAIFKAAQAVGVALQCHEGALPLHDGGDPGRLAAGGGAGVEHAFARPGLQ